MPRAQVLVLEDRETVRDLWVDGLREAGYTAVGVESGTEALACLPVLQSKLILLDIRMADMDGIQFLAQLRANPLWSHIPVIIISGIGKELLRTTDRPLAELPALGVTAILQKPVDLQKIVEHARRAIGPPAAQRFIGKARA